MCGIFHFLGEDVTWIDHIRDVNAQDLSCLMAFLYRILPQVEMLDTFGGIGGEPISRWLVIIIHRGLTDRLLGNETTTHVNKIT